MKNIISVNLHQTLDESITGVERKIAGVKEKGMGYVKLNLKGKTNLSKTKSKGRKI